MGMRVLITSQDVRSSQIGADLLTQRERNWEVLSCHGAEAWRELDRGGLWDIVVWDLELGRWPHHRGAERPIIVAWCAPEATGALSDAMAQGADYPLVRHPGWESYFPEVLECAAERAAETRGRRSEQDSVDALRLVQQSLLGSMSEPALVTNSLGAITHFNDAAEQFFGHDSAAVIGAKLGLFFEPPSLADAVLGVLATGRSVRELRSERGLLEVNEDARGILLRTFLRRCDGSYALCDVKLRSVSSAAGRFDGCVMVVSESAAGGEEAARELAPAARLTTGALEAAAVPLAVVDGTGTVLRQNRAMEEFLRARGLAASQGRRFQEYLSDPQCLAVALSEVSRGRSAELPSPVTFVGRGPAQKLYLSPVLDGAGRMDAAVLALQEWQETTGKEREGNITDASIKALTAALDSVSRQADPEAILTGVLEAAEVLVGAEMGIAVVRVGDGLQMARASRAVSQGSTQALREAVERRLMTGAVPAHPTVSQVSSLHGSLNEEALRDVLTKEGVRTVCEAPLQVAGEVVGWILLGRRRSEEFEEGCSPLTQILAGCAANRVHTLGATRSTRSSATAQEKLLEVSVALGASRDQAQVLRTVAEAALDIINSECCCVQLLDEEGQQFEQDYTACRPGVSTACGRKSSELVWEAIRGGRLAVQTLPLLEGQTEAATEAAVPMLVDSDPLGAIISRAAPGKPHTDAELNCLQLLAAQASAALHSARLYEVSRRRSQHMEVIAAQAWQEEARARALFEVATAVSEKTDLPEILSVVTKSACTEIGFERARIYLADQEHLTLVGELEARADVDETVKELDVVPLRREPGNRLAEAALGSAPYVIDAVEDTEVGAVSRHERLYVPLVSQGMLVGLFVADNPQSGAPVSPQQTRLLRSLAGLASVAIERARVEKLRGTLISSVSHELRAPLASIRAYNELVLAGDAGAINDEQRLYLERVEKASARLERLIADLMNLSKLRAGDVMITRAPSDLSHIVQSVMDTMTPKAKDAGIMLEIGKVDPVPVTVTDQGRLEQVLTNLVDNAIKFNNEGGWVRISLRGEGAEAVLSVADNGPGIPKSAQALIFEEFQHGTDARSRAKEGAGLGLAIAKRVMGVLGGRMWLESEPGRGSTFYVSLPLEPVAEQVTAAEAQQPGLPMNLGDTHERAQNTNH